MRVQLSKRTIGIVVTLTVIAGGGIILMRQSSPVPNATSPTNDVPSSTTPAITPNSANQPQENQSTTPAAQPAPTPASQTAAASPAYSTDDPSSIWFVVNKKRPLPSTYAPTDLVTVGGKQLRSEAANAIKSLVGGAAASGLIVKYVSGYRSYSYQTTLYNNYVAADGQAKADTYSARPGHSEHQTGLAIDVGSTDGSCELEICFSQTATGKWIAAHAYEYGFVIRYTADKTAVTGYQYEPWHLRYVGTWLALKLQDNPQTLEEYFGLGAAPGY